MNKQTEALKQARNYVSELVRGLSMGPETAAAQLVEELDEALAEQPAQQEPVAWLYPDNLGRKIVKLGAKKPIIARPETAEPLYTSPPASKPLPLTERHISKLWSDAHNDTTDRMAFQVLARLVEAAHGIESKV